jgi:hypothetical protein
MMTLWNIGVHGKQRIRHQVNCRDRAGQLGADSRNQSRRVVNQTTRMNML